MMADQPGQNGKRIARKTLVGKVITAGKTPKTIRVEVQSRLRHPKYGKYLTRVRRFLAHDESGQAHVGDRVQVMECRRISKLKTWRLVKVLESAPRE